MERLAAAVAEDLDRDLRSRLRRRDAVAERVVVRELLAVDARR